METNQLPDFKDINVRRSIYKEAYRLHLEDLEKKVIFNRCLLGICHCIYKAIKIYDSSINYSAMDIIVKYLPEFRSLRPEESKMFGLFWWDRRDYEIRKEIFEKHLINI